MSMKFKLHQIMEQVIPSFQMNEKSLH